jgi:hypothetical protein
LIETILLTAATPIWSAHSLVEWGNHGDISVKVVLRNLELLDYYRPHCETFYIGCKKTKKGEKKKEMRKKKWWVLVH